MIQIGSRSRTFRAQAVAMGIVVTAMMALAAVGGYELGSSREQSNSFVVQPPTVQSSAVQAEAPAAGTTQDAPTVTGLQP